MKRKLIHTAALTAAAVSSGALLCAAFPPYGAWLLAWVGLVPLLWAACVSRPRTAFLCGFAGGAVFFLGIFDWIRVVPGYTALHHGLLAVFLGSFFAWFALAVSLASRRLGAFGGLLAAPFLWVLVEYLRSNFFFLALPWGLLAHSQYRFLWVLQSVSIAGVYGVGFLVVLVNAAAAGAGLGIGLRGVAAASNGVRLPDRRQARFLAAAAVALTAAVLLFGAVSVRRPIDGDPIRLALVQGNIGLAVKRDPVNAASIMESYARLTREAAAGRPELIVWPENATPRSMAADRAIFEQVRRLSHETGAHLLLGSSSLQKFNVKEVKRSKFSNSAFLVAPRDDGRPPQRYDKIRLFPFGEYLPHKDVIPWDSIGVPAVAEYLPGSKFTLLDIGGVPFAVTICWENLFPDLTRQFVGGGARFIVNITNEAWFGGWAAPEQFLSMGVMRAVENRVYVARCGNTGISCVIDPCGRVVDRIKDKAGREVFVSGYLASHVIPLQARTLYTRLGDWLPGASVFTLAVFSLAALRKAKK